MNLEALPLEPALNNRSDLVEWTWEMHNMVNDQLGKPQISMDEFLDHISSLSPSQAAANGISPSSSAISNMAPNMGVSGALLAGLIVGGVFGYIAFKKCK